MTKQQKQEAVAAITEQLQEHGTVYLTDYSGLTVAQANTLRGEFRQAGVQYKVLKNTLVRRAMEGLGGYEEIFDHLHGPTAVAFTNNPAAPARVIKEFLKGSEKPQLKIAFVDGAVYPGDQLDVLASLKSKEDLIGDIVGLLLAPITNVVGGLQAQGSNLVGALKTIAERESA